MKEHHACPALPVKHKVVLLPCEVALQYPEHTAHQHKSQHTKVLPLLPWIPVNLDIRLKTDTHKQEIQGNLSEQETLKGHASKHWAGLITVASTTQSQGMLLPQQHLDPIQNHGMGVPSGGGHNKRYYNNGYKGDWSGIFWFGHKGKLNRFLTVAHCLRPILKKKNKNNTQKKKSHHKTQTQNKTKTTNLNRDKGTVILIPSLISLNFYSISSFSMLRWLAITKQNLVFAKEGPLLSPLLPLPPVHPAKMWVCMESRAERLLK